FVLHLEALALREDLERRIERMTIETAQLENLGAARELDLPALAPHVHLPDVVTVRGDVDERGGQGVATTPKCHQRDVARSTAGRRRPSRAPPGVKEVEHVDRRMGGAARVRERRGDRLPQ